MTAVPRRLSGAHSTFRPTGNSGPASPVDPIELPKEEIAVPEQLDTKILPLLPLSSGVVLPAMVVTVTLETDEPGALADTAGYSPDLSFEQKLEVLETLDVEQRLTKVLAWAKDTLAEASLKDKIRSEVTEGLQKNQREYILRQQLEAIKKELGEDSEENVVEEYRKKIDKAGMPEDVKKEALRELGRLERTSEQNPEYGWIRTYLDWMVELPWNVRTEDNLDIDAARKILDEGHNGL